METIRCPRCGHENTVEYSSICVNCGCNIYADINEQIATTLHNDKKQISKKTRNLIIIFVIITIISIIYFSAPRINKEEIIIAQNEFENQIILPIEEELQKKTGFNDLSIDIKYRDLTPTADNNGFWSIADISLSSNSLAQYKTTKTSREEKDFSKIVSQINSITSSYISDDGYNNIEENSSTYEYLLDNGKKLTFIPYFDSSSFNIYIDEKDSCFICSVYGDDSIFVKYNDTYILSGTKSNSSNPSSNSSNNSYSGSYDATLKYSGTSDVLICISEDAMERFFTAVANGNEGTINEMQNNSEIAYTSQGTKCNILDKKLTKCQVEILDGIYEGNTVWVVIEAIQENK